MKQVYLSIFFYFGSTCFVYLLQLAISIMDGCRSDVTV